MHQNQDKTWMCAVFINIINTAEGERCSHRALRAPLTWQARMAYSTWQIESAGNSASKRAQARSR